MLLSLLGTDGSLEWSRVFVSSDFYEPSSLLSLPSGGFAISGYVQRAGSSSWFIIELDSDFEYSGYLEMRQVNLESIDITEHSQLVFTSVLLSSASPTSITHFFSSPSVS